MSRAHFLRPSHTPWVMRVLAALPVALALASPALAAPKIAATVTISIVGTSDLHGHIAALPWLSGYLANLRAARARGGGAVILLDAGDMFQGTLESNLAEGAPVVADYNVLGYSAAAIGNHEFDFGPVGPAPAPVEPGDDPRGALKARAAEAHFPFLGANIIDRNVGKPVAWPNVKPSTIVEIAGIKVGIVGVTTAGTGRSALPANVAGLAFAPLARTIASEARRLREALGGADRCPRILFKRDDLTDLALGGNKARKLEFLIGDARAVEAAAERYLHGDGSERASAVELLDTLLDTHRIPDAADLLDSLSHDRTRGLLAPA